MKRLRIVSEDGLGYRVQVMDADGNDLSGYFSAATIHIDAGSREITATLECPFITFDVVAEPKGAESRAMLDYIEKRQKANIAGKNG
jgi:hypothetical protein